MTRIADYRINRRDLLRGLGVGAAATASLSVLGACGVPEQKRVTDTTISGKVGGVLNLLTWEGYADPAFVAEFERRTGAKVNANYVGSNDEMVTKLRSTKNLYDVASPSCDTTRILIDAGLVRPIDRGQVPNIELANPQFRDSENVTVDGHLYGSPMMFGFLSMLANSDVVKNPEPTWGMLWDKQYAGRLTVWNDISTLWNTGLLLGKKDLYNFSDQDLADVKSKMIEQRPLLKKYWSSAGELIQLFVNREVDVAGCWGGFHALQLKAQGMNVTEILPREGVTAYWDTWMIPTTAPNPATAQAWMNYCLEGEVQKTIADVTGFGVTSTAAIPLMSPDYVASYHLKDEEFFRNASWWQRVPNRQAYLEVLTEVQGA